MTAVHAEQPRVPLTAEDSADVRVVMAADVKRPLLEKYFEASPATFTVEAVWAITPETKIGVGVTEIRDGVRDGETATAATVGVIEYVRVETGEGVPVGVMPLSCTPA